MKDYERFQLRPTKCHFGNPLFITSHRSSNVDEKMSGRTQYIVGWKASPAWRMAGHGRH